MYLNAIGDHKRLWSLYANFEVRFWGLQERMGRVHPHILPVYWEDFAAIPQRDVDAAGTAGTEFRVHRRPPRGQGARDLVFSPPPSAGGALASGADEAPFVPPPLPSSGDLQRVSGGVVAPVASAGAGPAGPGVASTEESGGVGAGKDRGKAPKRTVRISTKGAGKDPKGSEAAGKETSRRSGRKAGKDAGPPAEEVDEESGEVSQPATRGQGRPVSGRLVCSLCF